MLVSGGFNIGHGKIKAQYGITEGDETDNERTTTSVGYDHKIAKATKLYTYYTINEQTDGATDASEEQTYLAFGMEHKF